MGGAGGDFTPPEAFEDIPEEIPWLLFFLVMLCLLPVIIYEKLRDIIIKWRHGL